MAWLVWLVVFYLPVIAGCLAYLMWTGGTYGLVMHTVGEQPWSGIAWGVSAAIPVVVGSRLLVPRVAVLRRLADGLGELMGPLPWSAVILVALLSALGEELLFRAVIQEQLGAPLGVLLFAVTHLPIDRKLWPRPLFALLAGALFAGLYTLTGSMLAPATAHFVINATSLRWAGRRHLRAAASSKDFAT